MTSPIATKQQRFRSTADSVPIDRGQDSDASRTVEAWARVIHDLMYLAPQEKRRKILERVLEIGESDNPALVCAADIRPDSLMARSASSKRFEPPLVKVID